ncbi:methyl-accepting chemotaxis protein [Brevibacillus fluminis]|uniref:Methyl-accepting chemotaxis protein n=1 Tax=Brevibacillus fluminis TaxID=511487 RepID=A0A3M8DSB1_9BACL|nr:methyl-accepting chemotaxis protein [Brevibacillus fluminis]RNB89857.1 methyl-accepting chemotaxis protein [Brevibacillus fluminis]
MRISAMLKAIACVFVSVIIIIVACVLLLNSSYEKERATLSRQSELKQLGIDLANASDYLTEQARRYAVSGKKQYVDNYWREVNETKTRDRIVERLKELQTPQNELDLIEQAKQNSDSLVSIEDAAMKAVEQNDLDKARELMFDDQYDQKKSIIMKPIEEFQQKMNSRAQAEADQARQQTGMYLIVLSVLVGVIAVTLFVSIAVLFKKLKPLLVVAKRMEELSSNEGDLTARLHVQGKDEIAQLAKGFNSFLQNLQLIIQKINAAVFQIASSAEQLTASAEQTSQATEEISTTIQEMASGSEQQAESVHRGASTIREMAGGVKEISHLAEDVSELARETTNASIAGNQSIGQAVTQMNEIHTTIQGLAAVVTGLGEKSGEIGNIINVITSIAAETNLLALNAAIEAARAGEHGRGFAVVANEVRKLAEQSSSSSQQISALITTIQTETAKVVHAMEKGTKEVAEGIKVVNAAGQSFAHIQSSVRFVAEKSSHVSTLSKGVSTGTDQVVQSIAQIQGVAEAAASGTQNVSAASQEQLASMEEITSSAEALAKMAEELQELVGKFKV